MILRGSCDAMRKIVRSSVVSALLHRCAMEQSETTAFAQSDVETFLNSVQNEHHSRAIFGTHSECADDDNDGIRNHASESSIANMLCLIILAALCRLSSLTALIFAGATELIREFNAARGSHHHLNFPTWACAHVNRKLWRGEEENSEIHQVNSCARASDTCEISKKVVDTSALERRRDGSLNKPFGGAAELSHTKVKHSSIKKTKN